jgi:hypothetical protein
MTRPGLDALPPLVDCSPDDGDRQEQAVRLRADGIEVTRATALRIRRVTVEAEGLQDGQLTNTLPTQAKPMEQDHYSTTEPRGSRLAVEYLFEGFGGYYVDPSWMRLRIDVIAGERPCPVARIAYVADFASGEGHVHTAPVSWINADVAINICSRAGGRVAVTRRPKLDRTYRHWTGTGHDL